MQHIKIGPLEVQTNGKDNRNVHSVLDISRER